MNYSTNFKTDVAHTRGPKFFYVIKIWRKTLHFVKYKSIYGTVEPFSYWHLCNTDTSLISTADNFQYPDQILIHSFHNEEPSWYRPSLIKTTHPERPTIMVSLYSEKRSTSMPVHVSMHTSNGLKSYTVLNLIKRKNLLYGHFASSISSFVLKRFKCSVFAAVSVNR